MIFAELLGKLGEDYQNATERAEDLFTSTVFGLLRYIPLDLGVIPFLARARRVSARGLEPQHPMEWHVDSTVDIRRFTTEFWPRLTRSSHPDIVLHIGDARSRRSILIEAKLHSGKSGLSRSDEDTDGAERPEPDQLARYWQALCETDAVIAGSNPYLLYLTSHASAPMNELQDSVRIEPTMTLLWASWRDVWETLSESLIKCPQLLPAADLVRLLEHKRLTFFTGFSLMSVAARGERSAAQSTLELGEVQGAQLEPAMNFNQLYLSARRLEDQVQSFCASLDRLMQENGWEKYAGAGKAARVIYPDDYRLYFKPSEAGLKEFAALQVELEEISPATDAGCLFFWIRLIDPKEPKRIWLELRKRTPSLRAIGYCSANPGLWHDIQDSQSLLGLQPSSGQMKCMWIPLTHLGSSRDVERQIVKKLL